MKVRIYKDQSVPENADLFVWSDTGDYGPFDLIFTYRAGNPGFQVSALQAQFVKFGSIVYREAEYVDVLSQLGLVNLKPDTLTDMLTADQSAIVVDKNPLDNIPDVPPADTLAQATPADNFATTTDPVIPDVPVTDVSSTTPAVDTSTTAPAVDTTGTGDATTVPVDTPPADPNVVTTTPTVDPSATTPPATDVVPSVDMIDTSVATTTPTDVPLQDSSAFITAGMTGI